MAEGAVRGIPIQAQSEATGRAAAGIGNAERGVAGSHGGHDGLPLTVSQCSVPGASAAAAASCSVPGLAWCAAMRQPCAVLT